ncbi:CYFA0S02e00606g1_1 [Cyberlindnera fabianii]|uniref:CYFA0S02e00606g1_1 n=1 Tax=Cyberlindnera fabianii TaxID=36022 RepID=A0A061AUE7_CYBFA|nr:Cullin-associated NEDD8-dissociated protein 1 [Cyberlindnera fabianii]CDR38348.1 CYFA0S02e00606g1_1 [Cyberlindnera fabianii]
MSSTDFKGADKKLTDINSKFRDSDPDLRFMALSDLQKLLTEHSLIINKVNTYSTPIVKLLLEALQDPNSDVQNQALRCFEPLVGTITDEETLFMVTRLNASQTNTNSITTTIQTMAISEILKYLNLKHASSGTKIVDSLLPSMIGNNQKIESLDSIEILTDIVKNLGTTISDDQLTTIYGVLVNTIFNAENIIAKKAITCLGLLASQFNNEQFKNVIELISNTHGSSYESISRALLTYISLANADVTQLVSFLDYLFQFAVTHLYLEDDEISDDQTKIDEVRFDALHLIGVLLKVGTPASKFIDQILEIVKKFLVYDPYNNMMDDDDENDFSDPEFSDEEYDDVDDQSDDNTWKLRKESSKLASTIVLIFPNTLLQIYTSGIFEAVLKSISDSSDAVAFENIKTLDTLVQASLTSTSFRSSRKRTSSDVTMADTHDPSSYLSKFRSSIVQKFIKELNGSKGNTLNKYNEFLNFFQSYSNLEDSLKPLLACIRQHNFGLNLDLLTFYSAVLRDNRLENFGDEFPHIIEIVNSGLVSKNHISITNSIGTAIDLLDLSYNDALTNSIIEIASSNKNDSGIRNTAIACLGQLKSLPDSKVVEILNLFVETLKYEPIVVQTAESITSIAETYGSKINCSVMEDIINSYKGLLSNVSYFSVVIDSLVIVSTVVPVDASVGDLLLQWFEKGTHQSQILRILSHLDFDKQKLTEIFLQASSTGEVEETALMDVSIKIGPQLIPTLEQNSDNDMNIKILANVVSHYQLTDYVSQREADLLAHNNVALNLKFLGYVGETLDLSVTVEQLMKFFDDEDTKIYAAETIGNVAAKDSTKYLPEFLNMVKNQTDRYLLLVSIKQILKKDTTLTHEMYSAVWDTMITICQEESTTSDESLKRVISHNIGLILVKNNDSNFFYTKASDLLDSGSNAVVYIIVAAIKFILAYDDIVSMDLIDTFLIKAFNKIASDDLPVKQVAMITLITALNNQFTNLTPYLPRILPNIYNELATRKEFQETIQIGPFKHKIDKALEVRKNAFELLYKLTLNHAVLKNVDFNEILAVVVEHGLKADIISISSLVIMKLLEFDDVVLSDENKELLNSGISKILLAIKKKEDQGKDSKEEQETKNTLLTLRNTVFPS